MAALPEELIEDILLRLPVKSLLQFKPASRKWYASISNDCEFAKRHLKQSSSSSSLSKNRLSFYQNHASQAIAVFQSSHLDDESITRAEIISPDAYSLEIKFPKEVPSSRIMGCANGLICVVPWGEMGCFFLWNSSTGDCKKIVSPTLSKYDFSVSGFAYDSCSDDYKIVGTREDPPDLGIFSLKENSWKIYKHKLSYDFVDGTAQFFNGAFHWCLVGKVIAFDLAKGEFFDIEMPEETRLGYRRYSYSSDVKVLDWLGSFCLYDYGTLWVMKRYGVAKSWTKLATDHVKLPVGFPFSKIGDSFPLKESLISPKYLINLDT